MAQIIKFHLVRLNAYKAYYTNPKGLELFAIRLSSGIYLSEINALQKPIN